MERKPHLVNWDTVCLDKRKGGLGVRRLSTLNRPFFASGIGVLRMKGRTFGGMSLVGSSGRKKGVGFLEKLGRVME